MFKPDFIANNEAWCIWLLGNEFNGKASPQQIVERTGLTLEQVNGIILDLERMKAIRVERIPGKFPPENIKKIGLKSAGTVLYEELLQRQIG